MLAEEGVDLVVGLHGRARLDLRPAIGVEGLLGEDLAGQPHAVAEIRPVLLMAHIVEADARIGLVGSADFSVTAPRDFERIGPTWAWKPWPSAAALPS